MNSFAFVRIASLVIMTGLIFSACNPASNLSQSELERVTDPQVSEADLTAVVAGNNTFALEMYQGLRSSSGNLFFSPYSITQALAMTYAGARGETSAQMAEVFDFTLPQEQLHPALNRLDLDLLASSASVSKDQQPMQLSIANAVWAQQDHPFLEEFLDLIATNYGAGINLADFVTKAEPTRKEINEWVSDQTRDRIKDIIPAGAISADTRMVLVNAIYFLADWLSPFNARDTHDAPFYLLDGTETQVRMMANDGVHLPYLRGPNFQAVELPYAGGNAVMDILLPDEGQFEAFDSSLDWTALSGILVQMEAVQVQLQMPKFTFSSQFSLKNQLTLMGMTDAFDPGAADFSGMDGKRDLFISDVIHKAFVAVDEKGTEAAAATAVIMKEASMPVSGVDLNIDRPFIFLIRDTTSGQVLFVGRLVNP